MTTPEVKQARWMHGTGKLIAYGCNVESEADDITAIIARHYAPEAAKIERLVRAAQRAVDALPAIADIERKQLIAALEGISHD